METGSKEPRDPKTYAIIGAAMAVHSELGCGFLEKVYDDALKIEFSQCHIPFTRENPVPVICKNQTLGTPYRADFLCYEEVTVELKALKAITPIEQAQVLHYLKATGLGRALVLNFGTEGLTYQRFVNERTNP